MSMCLPSLLSPYRPNIGKAWWWQKPESLEAGGVWDNFNPTMSSETKLYLERLGRQRPGLAFFDAELGSCRLGFEISANKRHSPMLSDSQVVAKCGIQEG